MSVRNLRALFNPRTVAVIGASVRERAVGSVVMKNLLEGDFRGAVLPVNPKHDAVAGVLCYPDIASLPLAPELAVVCTPPAAVPEAIAQLAQRGAKAAVVLTAGLTRPQHATMLANARRGNMRILGPNCVGLLASASKLNASFGHMAALPGRTAFVSQSGALGTAILDWARARNVGFSSFVSLGDGGDVSFADTLAYLAEDPHTAAILLYIESVADGRAFMSAARKAAAAKPVIAIKSGRSEGGARAAASHTGGLAGSDAVFDAALRRAGILRVDHIDDLFSAAETLACCDVASPSGRLTILTNGGGPGVMAADELLLGGGELRPLSPAVQARLDAVLPANWSHGNPVDIIGDGTAVRWAASLQALLDDPGTMADHVLVVNVPTAVLPGLEAARAVADTLLAAPRAARRRVLTAWLGEATAKAARDVFAQHGVATYDTPDQAVQGFLHLTEYRRNQQLLSETPEDDGHLVEAEVRTAEARQLVAGVLAGGRTLMSEPEAKKLLALYGVPVVKTLTAAPAPDAAAALYAAEFAGQAVALKIVSPDISHKSDVGGVALGLRSAADVRAAAAAMLARVHGFQPAARLAGLAVQTMADKPRALELIAGTSTDPVFGPVVLFGHGGTAIEVVKDTALGLAPLNMTLAKRLMQRTRVFKLLKGYRDRPAVDVPGVQRTLVALSRLVQDLAEVAALDINPLLVDEHGVVAVDARVVLAPAAGPADARLAILPYPRELAEQVAHATLGPLTLRPIRPEDEAAHREFLLTAVDPADLRLRLGRAVGDLPHAQLAAFTQIDYDREMCFIAQTPQGSTLGNVRLVLEPVWEPGAPQTAEFGLLVARAAQHQGLAKMLMDKAVAYARARGVGVVRGLVLKENTHMRAFCREYGFAEAAPAEAQDDSVTLTL